jgi:hypothetical protein
MASGDVAHHMTEPDRKVYRTSSPMCEDRRDTRFMKHNIEKHSVDDMQYFSRELYIRFNSADPVVADAADALWERAIENYKRHMRSLSRQLPYAAKKLAKLSFHDSELMNPKRPVVLALPEFGLITLAQRIGLNDWQTYLIWYLLCGEVRELPAPAVGWPFSTKHAQWLYDEFDVDPENKQSFVHRIFLSDGRVVVIPFTDAGAQKLAKDASSLTKQVMQLA